jgi:hypothetical protein
MRPWVESDAEDYRALAAERGRGMHLDKLFLHQARLSVRDGMAVAQWARWGSPMPWR